MSKLNGVSRTKDNSMDSARRIAEIEEERWSIILGNPAKVRYVVDAVAEELERGPRGCVDPPLGRLLGRVKGLATATGKRQAFGRARARLVTALMEADSDRELVKVAADEAIRRGTRRGLEGRPVLSRHAADIEAASLEVDRARHEFIRENQGLVTTIAQGYRQSRMPLADRIQEGNLGLIKAVNRYDYRLGYQFSTYASWWIRASIGRALDNKESMIRVPGSALRNQSQLKKAAREIWLRTGRKPTDEEIEEESGMGRLRLSRARKHQVAHVFSLDQTIGDTDELKYVDTLVDEHAQDPLEEVVLQRELASVSGLLTVLTDLERSIVESRFGLGDVDTMTLKEIGDQYGLSRERIRQIQNRALGKLREKLQLDAA